MNDKELLTTLILLGFKKGIFIEKHNKGNRWKYQNEDFTVYSRAKNAMRYSVFKDLSGYVQTSSQKEVLEIINGTKRI